MINKVLLYNSGGGIGDSIQIIPLIISLKSELKDASFYYLTSHENLFNTKLKDFNCNINSLDLDIKYFGFRWWHILAASRKIKEKNIKKFSLIIDLQSKIRNSLILKTIPHDFFLSTCFNFKFTKPKINVSKEKKINNTIIKALNSMLKKNINLNEYDISKIDKKFFDEADKLLPNKNYVGFSITQGNVYRKKEWNFDKIKNLANKLKGKNKIPVFFIEKKNHEIVDKINKMIPGSLFPEHASSLTSPALVTCLGKKLDFAISIDNGIMHMLALSKVPMISLFGPTDSEKFAPDYKNSIILDSKKLYNTKDVSSISVEDVLQASTHFVKS